MYFINLSYGAFFQLHVCIYHSTASNGVFIENLEEEDFNLLQGHTLIDSDLEDSDFIYHERMRPDVLEEEKFVVLQAMAQTKAVPNVKSIFLAQ